MKDIPDLDEAVGSFVDVLEAIGVDYMITGSLACSLHGIPRMTRDADIVIDTVDADRPFMVSALAHEFEIDPETIASAYRERFMFNVLRKDTLAKIDVIFRKPAWDTDEVMARRRIVEHRDRKLKIISPEDLAIAKLEWARDSHSEMQLRDVAQLLALPDVDMAYIERQASRRGLRALLDEASGERYAP